MAEYKKKGSLFAQIPEIVSEEIFDTLFKNDGLKIERIISQGNSTPRDNWLEQNQDEWVLLVQGAAKLSFKDKAEIIEMKPGEYVLIKANTKHRVEWTDPKQKTVWLAVHGKHKKK